MDQFLAYFGHHKCASRYIISICENAARALGLSTREYTYKTEFNEDLVEALKLNPVDFLYYSNAEFEYVQPLLDQFRGFHLIRDPRDIVVSGYFSHLKTHTTEGWGELEEYRAKLQSVSQDEGLFMEIDYNRLPFDVMGAWEYDHTNILELKYEDMIVNPYQMFLEVFEFLGYYVPVKDDVDTNSLSYTGKLFSDNLRRKLTGKRPPQAHLTNLDILGTVNKKDFRKIAGKRKPGEEDRNSHYRKGIAGDWKNVFTPKHVAYFKEQYQDVLVKLGYEEDDSWNV